MGVFTAILGSIPDSAGTALFPFVPSSFLHFLYVTVLIHHMEVPLTGSLLALSVDNRDHTVKPPQGISESKALIKITRVRANLLSP